MSSRAVTESLQYEALPGRVVFGVGAIDTLPAELDRLGCGRVLVIDGLLDQETVGRVVDGLEHRYAETLTITRQHVPADLADTALEIASRVSADCLLSLGGGSALGVAKSVALKGALPIVAVPTTYAGSEMTPIWGVTTDGSKTTGRDLRVLPRTVVYDPELTLSLTPAATGASGMNAVAHCVEALWTEHRNPVTDAVAGEGMRLLAGGLRASVADPSDLDARSQALRGAWLGGLALAGGGTGLHHKICHVLGGRFDLPHAEVHAAVLPWVVEHYRSAAPDALRRIATALQVDDAVVGLQALAADLSATAGLRKLGLSDEGAESTARSVAASAPAQPAPTTREGVLVILQAAMAGAAARR